MSQCKCSIMLVVLLQFCFFANATFAQEVVSGNRDSQTNDRILSYEFGRRIAANLLAAGVNIDLDSVLLGIKDVQNAKPPKYDNKTLQDAIAQSESGMKDRRVARSQKQLEAFQAENKQFIEKNAQTEGVTVRPSGVQYQVLREGTGKPARPKSQVTINYVSKFIDGQVFESSENEGGAVKLRLELVPSAIREVLLLMKQGAKVKVVVPPEKSAVSNPRVIIWEVDLVEVGE